MVSSQQHSTIANQLASKDLTLLSPVHELASAELCCCCALPAASYHGLTPPKMLVKDGNSIVL